MKISRFNYIVLLGIALSALILLQGCGASNRVETAPDGSTITFDPQLPAFSISADTCFNFNVIVRYPDGTPFPRGVLTISGNFAAPRNVAGDGARYQFYSAPQCNLPGAVGVAVNSGFQGQTNVKGVYSFSALVPALVTITTSTGSFPAANAFKDTLVATSGTAVGVNTFELQSNP